MRRKNERVINNFDIFLEYITAEELQNIAQRISDDTNWLKALNSDMKKRRYLIDEINIFHKKKTGKEIKLDLSLKELYSIEQYKKIQLRKKIVA